MDGSVFGGAGIFTLGFGRDLDNVGPVLGEVTRLDDQGLFV